MKVETFNTLNLITIGQVRFRWNKKFKRTGNTHNVLISEMHIMCETDRNITPETEKAIHKMMKANKSELLTDGHDFYTTRGTKITQVKHGSFESLKNIYSEEIHELLYK